MIMSSSTESAKRKIRDMAGSFSSETCLSVIMIHKTFHSSKRAGIE